MLIIVRLCKHFQQQHAGNTWRILLSFANFHPLVSRWQTVKKSPDPHSSGTLRDEKCKQGWRGGPVTGPRGNVRVRHISSLLSNHLLSNTTVLIIRKPLPRNHATQRSVHSAERACVLCRRPRRGACGSFACLLCTCYTADRIWWNIKVSQRLCGLCGDGAEAECKFHGKKQWISLKAGNGEEFNSWPNFPSFLQDSRYVRCEIRTFFLASWPLSFTGMHSLCSIQLFLV